MNQIKAPEKGLNDLIPYINGDIPEYSGMSGSIRDNLLKMLITQAKAGSYCDRIIHGGDFLYSHTGVREKKIPSGAKLYAKIMSDNDYTDNDELQLFATMNPIVKKTLQGVDCRIYKGVGDGNKLLSFFLQLYDIPPGNNYKELLNDHLRGKKLILQDVGAEFLAKCKKLFSEYAIDICADLGDFFDQNNNGERQILGEKNCIVMLGKTAGNFESEQMQIMLGQNAPRWFGKQVYFYSSYETSNTTTDAKYKDNTAINAWILGGLAALFGKDHVDEVKHLKVIVKSHGQSNNKAIPERILVGVTPKKDIIIPHSDGNDTFHFRTGQEYFLIVSSRPQQENIETFLDPSIVYKHGEVGLSSEKIRPHGYTRYIPILEEKSLVFDRYEHWLSVFCELRPGGNYDDIVKDLTQASQGIRGVKTKYYIA